jgi:hypothetical protein
MTTRAALLFALSLAASACGAGATTSAPSAPDPARAVLIVHCPVARATLVIDDQPVGEIAEITGGVRLSAGEHRLELRHDRYHTRYVEVTLTRGERRTLELTMAEALP